MTERKHLLLLVVNQTSKTRASKTQHLGMNNQKHSCLQGCLGSSFNCAGCPGIPWLGMEEKGKGAPRRDRLWPQPNSSPGLPPPFPTGCPPPQTFPDRMFFGWGGVRVGSGRSHLLRACPSTPALLLINRADGTRSAILFLQPLSELGKRAVE